MWPRSSWLKVVFLPIKTAHLKEKWGYNWLCEGVLFKIRKKMIFCYSTKIVYFFSLWVISCRSLFLYFQLGCKVFWTKVLWILKERVRERDGEIKREKKKAPLKSHFLASVLRFSSRNVKFFCLSTYWLWSIIMHHQCLLIVRVQFGGKQNNERNLVLFCFINQNISNFSSSFRFFFSSLFKERNHFD